jgi:hypothetical protein
MTKWGRGVLLVITDAAPEFEAEFNEWYDREHLKDRVATAGFLSARRYVASEAVRKYLAVYETESIAVFESPAYKQKLAEQTDWSKRILKQFRNPHRAVARIGASQGFCVGGVASIAILAGGPATGADGLRTKVANALIPRLMVRPGILAAHLLESDPDLSQPVPEYPRDSEPAAAPDDWFLLFEASDEASLARVDLGQTAAALNVQLRILGVYRFMTQVSRSDLKEP